MIGKTIQGYRVDALLGEGGMGKVYLATDLALDRKVAIKNLNANLVYDTTFLERFTNEARILSRLSHPNIALLYNYIQVGSDHYMVMEYVEGDNMDTYVRKYGAVSPEQLVPILIALLDGLGYAHEKGVLHRDIKPANLMLVPNGSVKIMDFGIARISDQASRLTKVKSVIGTLDYLAPELIQGVEPSCASDCYALGVVAYELATGGTLPFKGTSEFALMQAIIGGQTISPDKLNKKVPKKLATIILRSMAADPVVRFSNTSEFRTALVKAFPNYRTVYPHVMKPVPSPTVLITEVPPLASTPDTTLFEPTANGKPLPTQLMDSADLGNLQPQGRLSKRYPYAVYATGIATAVLVIVALVLLTWPKRSPLAEQQTDRVSVMANDGGTPNQRLTMADNSEMGANLTPSIDVSQLISVGASSDESGESRRPTGNDQASKPVQKTKEEEVVMTVNESEKKPEQPLEKEPEVSVNPIPESEPRPEPERMPNGMVVDGVVNVSLRLRNKLDAAQLEKGKLLSFSVTKPVTYNGYTIIPQGALATAEIRRVTSRQVSIRFNNVQSVSGKNIPFANREFSGKISDMLASSDFIVMLEKGVTVP